MSQEVMRRIWRSAALRGLRHKGHTCSFTFSVHNVHHCVAVLKALTTATFHVLLHGGAAAAAEVTLYTVPLDFFFARYS